MTPDDLARLHSAAFTQQRPWSADEFASLLDSRFVFQATLPQAFALGRVIADEAELLTLATAPLHQRQGLGRQALAAYHTQAISRGATQSFLEVAETNSPAIQLYLSAGYSQSARRPDYYHLRDGSRVAALIMTRELP